jgi:hypothetical protein
LFLVLPRIHVKQQEQMKSSLYDSEPRLSNLTSVDNRYYSSMNDMQTTNRIRSITANHTKSTNSNKIQSIINHDCDISYDVDSPRMQTDKSSVGYLNAFLLKKRQQEQSNVQQLIAQFERPKSTTTTNRRPLSAPLVDQTIKPTKGILQKRINDIITPIPNKSSRKRSKSVTFECHSEDNNNNTSSTDDDKIQNSIDPIRSPRINIGITLDSRLRKTPVLDMLRSTTMESDLNEPIQLDRTTSLRQPFLPIARF